MKKVARIILTIFDREGEFIDTDLQAEVITNMYRYRTVIPMFYGDEHPFTSEDEDMLMATISRNSICDIIMEGVEGQVTEVVEHILHHVTDVGLHYTFPEEWGISKASAASLAMQEAIERKLYNVESYEEILDEDSDQEDIYHRILLQEYAYWIIYTYWDLRETFGPTDGDEYIIMNSGQLEEMQPASYKVVAQTVPRVMVAPGREMLSEFFE